MIDQPPTLVLRQLPQTFAVCRLAPDDPLPAWISERGWWSITRTDHELSIVCDAARLPVDAVAERGWRGLMVQGPLPFGLTGILASLATPLADARISIFAISTYDTDYLLVKDRVFGQACDVLRAAGHEVI